MYKALAILFSLFAFGSVKETFRIATSSAADIASNRSGLLPMALTMTILFIVLAVIFWKKALVKKL
ncbi:hypothetical protein VRU48_19535 [Pedobacter sp. KR3-3]|uniref:Uncharacterized protein n=1 Tax=Pedobacter albus TaxID=3113905 RepID=A0ABU7ICV2_9SPHI|nr:hypothetical protein [Pedobacter sp. KR3-3]MEE1947328.1 hypothetical protein [Pedobacter sp. KR3-3]